MKKQIVLLLLITSSTFNTMEKKFSFLTFFSGLLPKQTLNESILVSNLRAKRNELENKLRNEKVKQYLADDDMLTLAHPFNIFTISNPDKLLQYCYYLKFHNSKFNLRLFELDNRIINDCKKGQLDGYSALGAAIISDDTSIQEKRSFIQKLVNLGFKSTQKDIELAELIFYDGIARHQKTIMDLSLLYPKANWSVLPYDVREQIVRLLVQVFKKDAWLLPEKSGQQEDDVTYCIQSGIIKTPKGLAIWY